MSLALRRAASQRTGGFDPLSLSPRLWLDGADTATITSSGGLVSQWADKSTNGFHATQGTDANKPSTGVATENGRNVVSFLTSAAKISFPRPTTASACTVFVVQRTVDTQYLLLWDDPLIYSYVASSGSGSANTGGWGSPTYYKNGTLQSWATRDGVFTALNNQAAAVAAKTVNFSAAAATWHLGAYLSFGFTGTLCEIIIYPTALSDADRNAVDAYLRNKWGTP